MSLGQRNAPQYPYASLGTALAHAEANDTSRQYVIKDGKTPVRVDGDKPFPFKDLKEDKVNNPAHYNKAGVECIDAIESATADLTGIEAVCTANIIKYTYRWSAKGGVEDLKKARWYLDRLIKKLEA
jgi:hypothetical protein